MFATNAAVEQRALFRVPWRWCCRRGLSRPHGRLGGCDSYTGCCTNRGRVMMGGPLEPPYMHIHMNTYVHWCQAHGKGLADRCTSTLATSPQNRSSAKFCSLCYSAGCQAIHGALTAQGYNGQCLPETYDIYDTRLVTPDTLLP
jgi:hypothetical protein